MREHPVPQDITGYQFHIIGNMTIKQFAEVAAGCFVAFLIYTTNLPTLIKWGLMAVSAGLGAAAAFVPIEEQPFDHWIMVFIKTLYKPTQYYWQKKSRIPDFFKFEAYSQASITIEDPTPLTPQRQKQVKEYLTSVQYTETYDSYDQAIDSYANQLSELFTQTPAPPASSQLANTQVLATSTQSPMTANAQPTVTQPLTENSTPPQTSNESSTFSIPDSNSVQIESSALDDQLTAQQTAEVISQAKPIINQTFTPQQQTSAPHPAATSNQDLPFPHPPTQPNKIVGMVLTNQGQLLDNAIVEIKNPQGQTVRAVKTNPLGQFFVTTPLRNGTYIIEIDDTRGNFLPQQITLNGSVVAPLEITSS